MRDALRSLLAEPRAPDAPHRVWRDWVLLAGFVGLALLEVAVRDDIVRVEVALPLAIGTGLTLLWRRTHPLGMLAITFGIVSVVDLVTILTASPVIGLNTMAFLIILPYSLFRWASGSEAAIGLIFIVLLLVLGNAADFTGIGEALGGSLVLALPAVMGTTVRYRASARSREMDQVRLHEREQLARELHDTVAHHVSAIAIRAQAGRALAAVDPHAPIDALRIVEEEASRTLAEMRAMVGVLRAGDEIDLAPQRGVADIARLREGSTDRLRIEVQLEGDLDALSPAVGSALYRLAQESITNAAKHARNATIARIVVSVDPESVRLAVTDDGDPVPAGRAGTGYGITGMDERVRLLGGTLRAGPGTERGWAVEAELPKSGSPT